MQPQNSELEAFIRRVPLFRDLPPPMFDVVRKACQLRPYSENDYLFQQGETTKGLSILISGEAALMQVGRDGLKRQIGMVRAGQFINQQALFSETIETASLKAVLPVTALSLSRRDMSALMAYYKELPALMGITAQSQTLHDMRFKTQRPDEQILLKTHRHPWAYARYAPLPVGVLLGMWLLATVIPPLTTVIVILSLVITGLMMTYLYAEWANDAVIITDQRVIRINRNILRFSESINEVLIHSIQEARADIPGADPFAVLFNYGVIDIRTGGQAGNFHLDFIPNPEAVQKLIMYDHQIRAHNMQAEERQEMRTDLIRWMNGQPVLISPAASAPTTVRPSGLLGAVEARPDGSVIFRKHWIVWLRGAMPGLGLLALALLLAFATLVVPFLRQISAFALVATFLMALVGGVWLWYADWDWRHDYMQVQATTITMLHQRPFWMKNERDQILLKQVDNVVAETIGFTARLLGYGTIRLSLVGADEHKVFAYTPNPQAVQGEITRRQAALKQKEDAARDEQEKARIGEYFQLYHEMQNGQDGQNLPAPSSRPPAMKTGEVPAVRPTMPLTPTPASSSNQTWQTAPNSGIPQMPTPPTPGSPTSGAPTGGRLPSGWTPPPSTPAAPATSKPPFVASGGQPDRNRPPRIPINRPSLSPGKPYSAPRLDQPPAPPEMPPRSSPFPRRRP